jgi:hypothetical protein
VTGHDGCIVCGNPLPEDGKNVAKVSRPVGEAAADDAVGTVIHRRCINGASLLGLYPRRGSWTSRS